MGDEPQACLWGIILFALIEGAGPHTVGGTSSQLGLRTVQSGKNQARTSL